MARVMKQLQLRVSTYRCKACGERFERRKPNCPVCKVRKGGRGQRLWGNSGMGMGG
jgi:rubrerythrin